MVTESQLEMLSNMGMSPIQERNEGSYGADLEEELGLLLREQHQQEGSDRERELNIHRSGSAPPTVEGSLTAVGGLFAHGGRDSLDDLAGSRSSNGVLSEEDLRSDPAYLSYYYSHVKLNPRLPPPILSKEDWRIAQRLQAGSSGLGGIGDRRKVNRVRDSLDDLAGSRSSNEVLSEEDLRSDPAYLSYYHSHVKLNPRLPPPILSKEDWRFGQRSQAGSSGLGGIGDRRKANRVDDGGGRSLFSMPPGFSSQKEESEVDLRKPRTSSEWLHSGSDGLIGLSGLGLGGRQKSLADIIQDDLGRASPIPGHPSRPASRNAIDDSADSQLNHLNNDAASGENGHNMVRIQSIEAVVSHAFESSFGTSLSRSTTPDPQLMARAPSPHLPPVGVRYATAGKRSINGLAASLSSMTLSENGILDAENNLPSQIQHEIDDHQNFPSNLQGGESRFEKHSYMKTSESGHLDLPSIPLPAKSSYPHLSKNNGALANQSKSPLMVNGQAELHKYTNTAGSPIHLQNLDGTNAAFTSYGVGGYSINPALPSMIPSQMGSGNSHPLFENSAAASVLTAPGMDSRALEGGLPTGLNLTGMTEFQSLNQMGNHAAASAFQVPLMDPLYIQYLRTAEYAAQVAANDPSMGRNYMGNTYVDLLQKAYLGSLLSPQKSQYAASYLNKTGSLNHGYYNPTYGLGMSYPGSPLGSPVLSEFPVGPGSPIRHNERNIRFPYGMRNLSGGIMGSWHLDNDESFASSLLEEFKSSKTKCFELSDIAGYVVEFSADQYGSRFIQQKLETATMEEKNMVFKEIIPQALSLMTDVFGNYVIQKFFEHGSATQIRELANQLTGQVLTLSLQMYGCRVIQKAIEVVGLDQQTKMVAELDGHIMRCVRDQNGNHVIQKCIECIPEDAIKFIISSFYDQVVTLSTHPYGCRVIQRVLEHCHDPDTQCFVMDEILQCVCMLAQDQYGNYVVQHVLEHGKPHERSAIIKKLAGQIVQMSQQKFASNVVEKCLTFGGLMERQILVNEMLGSTDENEPLQAMMKDQFANYVVQKVLETCDDQQRELILSRIKVHLNALKKYTYGKHIVARVEKLVAAGERRIGLQSSYPSQMM